MVSWNSIMRLRRVSKPEAIIASIKDMEDAIHRKLNELLDKGDKATSADIAQNGREIMQWRKMQDELKILFLFERELERMKREKNDKEV